MSVYLRMCVIECVLACVSVCVCVWVVEVGSAPGGGCAGSESVPVERTLGQPGGPLMRVKGLA